MIVFVVELPQVAARQEAYVAMREMLGEFRLGQLAQKFFRVGWVAVLASLCEVFVELVDPQRVAAEGVAGADRGDPQHAGGWGQPIDSRVFKHAVVDQHHCANLSELA